MIDCDAWSGWSIPDCRRRIPDTGSRLMYFRRSRFWRVSKQSRPGRFMVWHRKIDLTGRCGRCCWGSERGGSPATGTSGDTQKAAALSAAAFYCQGDCHGGSGENPRTRNPPWHTAMDWQRNPRNYQFTADHPLTLESCHCAKMAKFSKINSSGIRPTWSTMRSGW